MAVVLAVAVAALVTLVALLGPDNPSVVLRVVHDLAQWTGPLVVVALVWQLAAKRVAAHLRKILIDIVGPALIRAMPPRAVLESLLTWIYGDVVNHQDVLVGMLGGAGRDPHGRDTAVSASTTAEFRLRAIDDVLCATESIWTHEFSGVREAHKFVVFATADSSIARLIASERIHPLFEVWALEDEDQLADFVLNLRNHFEIGITYVDSNEAKHRIPPRPVWGEEVPLRNYDQFVRLRENIDRKDLQIIEFDLWDLANPDHVVERVESLTFRATSIGELSQGFFTWSPPHPCFVEKVTFDVTELAPSGQAYDYRILPFTIRSAALSVAKWSPARQSIDVSLGSWMLPGHGITLLWRVAPQGDLRP